MPTGGKALRLEDLQGFLRELKAEAPPDVGKKPRYYPDWHRNRSRGFLPLWLVVTALLLGGWNGACAGCGAWCNASRATHNSHVTLSQFVVRTT